MEIFYMFAAVALAALAVVATCYKLAAMFRAGGGARFMAWVVVMALCFTAFAVQAAEAHDANNLVRAGSLLNNPCGIMGYARQGIVKSPFCELEARITVLENLLREAYRDACKPRGSYKCTFAVPDELRQDGY